MTGSVTRTHQVTGATLIRGTRPCALAVGTCRLTIEMPGWYAVDDHKGEHGLHDAYDMQISDEAIDRLRIQWQDRTYRNADPRPIDTETSQIIEKE